MKKFNLPDWTQTELTDKIEFQFCAMPRELVYGDTFEELGVYGTFIYTLMLDRMRLSAKNSEKFTDKNGRLYIIFTIEEVMRVCKCAKHTAVKYMKQLEDIGLIEKKKQGQGRPALIYVKNFNSTSRGQENRPLEVQNLHARGQENRPLEVQNLHARGQENRPLEVQNLHANQTDPIQTELSKTYVRESQISQIGEVGEKFEEPEEFDIFDANIEAIEAAAPDLTDLIKNRENISENAVELRSAEEIADKVELAALKDQYPDYHQALDVMHKVICNFLANEKEPPNLRVRSQPIEFHRARPVFAMLAREHLASVIDALIRRDEKLGKIRDGEAYFTTSLYQAALNPKVSLTVKPKAAAANRDSRVPAGFNKQDFFAKLERDKKKLLDD